MLLFSQQHNFLLLPLEQCEFIDLTAWLTLQVVYKANKLSTLIKKKQNFEGKLERVFQFMSREPKADRPLVKVQQLLVMYYIMSS